MDGTCSLQQKENAASNHTRKRKRKQKRVDPLDVRRLSFSLTNDDITVDNLPDDILVAILSRTSIKDAVRTSVISRRWRYLWMFIYEKLEFHNRDIATGTIKEGKSSKPGCIMS